ncbi:hypothetical protein GCM10010121_087250 [Streptomyces brasiliensis]|uniref:Transposase n=1 Tax=Streptomyces brasiliensis TaxID=1954 RepID=A0A917UKJ9_9ACTN|nr:hypothetical protein GCM10010121_087250 [Streptomyces brasiliensis]
MAGVITASEASWTAPFTGLGPRTFGRLLTALRLPRLAPPFGVSKSAAAQVIHDFGPKRALQLRRRFAKGAVLIVDGTLVPTRDHAVVEQSKEYRYSTNHQVVIDADTRLVVAAGLCRATATTARRGSCPGRRPPLANHGDRRRRLPRY